MLSGFATTEPQRRLIHHGTEPRVTFRVTALLQPQQMQSHRFGLSVRIWIRFHGDTLRQLERIVHYIVDKSELRGYGCGVIKLPFLWEIHEASIKNAKVGGIGSEAMLLASLLHCSVICWTLAGNQELHEAVRTLNWYCVLCNSCIAASVSDAVTEQAKLLRTETQQRIDAVFRTPEGA